MNSNLISVARALLTKIREETTKVGSIFYHTSSEPIVSLKRKPFWLALEKDHAVDGWFKNTLENNGTAFLYSATLDRPVSHIRDSVVVRLFEKIHEDPAEWVQMIVGSPTSEEIYDHPATKALINAGHIGLVYSDYDPRNFQEDLDAIIIFDAAAHIKNLKLIKKSGV